MLYLPSLELAAWMIQISLIDNIEAHLSDWLESVCIALGLSRGSLFASNTSSDALQNDSQSKE